jgi:DsbC/DsbD-like thiol-disulfide interchange protein
MRMPSVRLFTLALVAGLTLTAVRATAAETSADKVKITPEAKAPDTEGNQVVTLTLEVEKGWHLYANPVGNEMLEESQVVVTATAKEKPESVTVEYPAGEVVKDKTLGDFKAYFGKVTIKAKVRRAKGDTSPLQVTIRLNACDEKMCLPQADVKLTLP